jgi:lipopolysaccharide transport system permease protein
MEQIMSESISIERSPYQDILKFWQLVVYKVRFNLRSEAAQSYLSYAWWLLEPLLELGIYYIVFAIFLKRGGDDFALFLICGIVPFTWFKKSVNNSGRSIVQGKGLISQTYLPKPFFPLVVVGQDLVKQTFVFLLMFSLLIYFGHYPDLNWLWLIPIVLTQLLLIIAACLVVSFVVPFARDLQFLISTGLMMLLFGSGVFYSYKDVLLQEHRQIFLLNPIANLLVSYRKVLLEDTEPLIFALFVIAVISVLVILLMQLLMKRYDNTLTRLALE